MKYLIMIDLILNNLPLIVSTLFGSGSFYAYWVERGKRDAETKQANSDALKSMQQAYDTFTKDSLERYKRVEKEIDSLELKVKELKEDLNSEKQKYDKLESVYNKLKLEYNILNNAYKSLQKEFDAYKKSEKDKKVKK